LEKIHYLLEYALLEAFLQIHLVDLLNDLMTHHIILTSGEFQQHALALGIYLI
jgi:hypothetical protein